MTIGLLPSKTVFVDLDFGASKDRLNEFVKANSNGTLKEYLGKLVMARASQFTGHKVSEAVFHNLTHEISQIVMDLEHLGIFEVGRFGADVIDQGDGRVSVDIIDHWNNKKYL